MRVSTSDWLRTMQARAGVGEDDAKYMILRITHSEALILMVTLFAKRDKVTSNCQ